MFTHGLPGREAGGLEAGHRSQSQGTTERLQRRPSDGSRTHTYFPSSLKVVCSPVSFWKCTKRKYEARRASTVAMADLVEYVREERAR